MTIARGSHYNSKHIYEELMAGHLPAGYRTGQFTAYAHGQSMVGFKPYRGHLNPNGKWDVRTEGKNSFVQVRLHGYGVVWASLHERGDHVTLLGWGNTDARLENFDSVEQTKLVTHQDSRNTAS